MNKLVNIYDEVRLLPSDVLKRDIIVPQDDTRTRKLNLKATNKTTKLEGTEAMNMITEHQ